MIQFIVKLLLCHNALALKALVHFILNAFNVNALANAFLSFIAKVQCLVCYSIESLSLNWCIQKQWFVWSPWTQSQHWSEDVYPQCTKKQSSGKTLFVSSEVFLMFITFSIFSLAGLAHTVSFFRVSTPTHSQAVCSATYMQFNAVITSVRLFQRGTHVLAAPLNKDALLFHHFFFPSHPFRWWLFFIMLRSLLQGSQPGAAQRKK